MAPHTDRECLVGKNPYDTFTSAHLLMQPLHPRLSLLFGSCTSVWSGTHRDVLPARLVRSIREVLSSLNRVDSGRKYREQEAATEQQTLVVYIDSYKGSIT